MAMADTQFSYTADTAACRAAIRHGSLSFMTASLLLPMRVREPIYLLYAFCRDADDAVDLGSDPEAAIEDLHSRLEAIYAGKPQDHSSDRAFADIVHRYGIPVELPAALLEGFHWDIVGRRYKTLDDLLAYATRVAGTVGAMMCLIMGRSDPQTVARGCDLGLAMQLTNIARDVGEDADAGRLYLPMDWMKDEGVDPEVFLATPEHSPGLANVVQRLLRAADRFYLQASTGVDRLPRACRTGIHAASLVYGDIGRVVADLGYNSIGQRARTRHSRKLALLLRAWVLAKRRKSVPMLDPTPETAFLVDAVKRNRQTPNLHSSRSESDFHNVLDTFNRLGLRDRTQAGTNAP